MTARPPSGTYPSVRPPASSAAPLACAPSSESLAVHRPGLTKCHAAKVDLAVATATAQPASLLSLALRSAIERLGCSVADAASWCEVERRTMQRWLNSDVPVSVECVLRSRRLWPVFLAELTELTVGQRRTGT